MSSEDWKTWPEPSADTGVAWRHKTDGLRMTARAGGMWYSAGSSGYGLTWSGLLNHIAQYGDGTTPRRIVDLAVVESAPEPEPAPERVVVWQTGDPIDKLLPYAGREGVEARAEGTSRTVVSGPLGSVEETGLVSIGPVFLIRPSWNITVTAPKPVAPWWQINPNQGDQLDTVATTATTAEEPPKDLVAAVMQSIEADKERRRQQEAGEQR